MDFLSRLFLFSPMKENKKFTIVFTQNISELATLPPPPPSITTCNVVTKETSEILLQTLALTETLNKFSQHAWKLMLQIGPTFFEQKFSASFYPIHFKS